jgi:hypothetical protein
MKETFSTIEGWIFPIETSRVSLAAFNKSVMTAAIKNRSFFRRESPLCRARVRR